MERIWSSYHQYPALYFLTFFGSGIFLGWLLLPWLKLWVLIPLCILIYIAVVLAPYRFPGTLGSLLLFLVCLCGIIHVVLALSVFPENHILNIPPDEIMSMEGVITGVSIREDGKNRYILSCDTLMTDSLRRSTTGRILVYQGRLEQRLDTGDRIVIRDRPEYPDLPRNPGSFNYRKYLQLNRTWLQYRMYKPERVSLIPSQPSSARFGISIIRDYMVQCIDRDFKPPARDIIKALLLGVKDDLDRQVLHDFQVTGVVHVLAISGLHVGFIVVVLSVILELFRVPFRARIPVLLFGLAFYVVLVDFKISVIRAALMAGIFYLSQAGQREVKALNTMAVAALIILILNPQQLFLPGFQFSFTAVGSILYGYEKVDQLLPDIPRGSSRIIRILRGIRQAFVVSFVAILGTFSITWYYYGYFPLSGVVLNLLIIPLTGGMVLGGLFYFFLLFIPWAPLEGFLQILHLYVDGIVALVQLVSRIPGLLLYLPNPPLSVLMYVITGIGLIIHFKKRTARFVFYGWLMLGITVSLAQHLSSDESPLKIWFADVGQGDAIIIRTPSEGTIVIDGGEGNAFTDKGRGVVLPLLRYYGMNRIKYLVVTHGHSDHLGGILSILQEIDVDTLIMSTYPMNTKLYVDVLNLAEQKKVPVRHVVRGDILHAGNQVRVYVLHPWGEYLKGRQFSGGEVNNSSVVLSLIHGKVRILLTGDLESTAESQLLGFGDLIQSDIIKAGHHGSKTSSSEALILQVKPEYVIVSVGRYNRFKHPSPKTLERYSDHNVRILRTDKSGAVYFESDGDTIKMINWRLHK